MCVCVLARQGQEGVYIYDLSGSSNPIQKADNLLTAFFGFTTAVAMLIASFSLVSSMYTNIYEQTKEIGSTPPSACRVRVCGCVRLLTFRC